MEIFTALPFWMLVISFAGVFAIFTLGLQVQAGTSGLPNFGHVASLAIGGYAFALSTMELAWPWYVAMPAAMVAAALGALLIGWPTLRLRGAYFAIATIAFAEIVRFVLLNEQDITGGARGIIGFTGAWREFHGFVMDILRGLGWRRPEPEIPMALATWTIAVIISILLTLLNRSPWGRTMRAIREDEDAALALGKPVLVRRLQAMMIGGAIAGLAGVFYAFSLGSVSPNVYLPAVTFLGYTMLIVGGATSPYGVLLGSVLISIVYAGVLFLTLPVSPQQLSALRIMAIGLILILVIVYRPQGILGRREEMIFERE